MYLAVSHTHTHTHARTHARTHASSVLAAGRVMIACMLSGHVPCQRSTRLVCCRAWTLPGMCFQLPNVCCVLCRHQEPTQALLRHCGSLLLCMHVPPHVQVGVGCSLHKQRIVHDFAFVLQVTPSQLCLSLSVDLLLALRAHRASRLLLCSAPAACHVNLACMHALTGIAVKRRQNMWHAVKGSA